MARQKKATPAGTVRHHEKAPCNQAFNIGGKPGVKKKTWWNGYRQAAPKPSDA